jgi:putative zinc finger/helix-turn-helix YgiT family protein
MKQCARCGYVGELSAGVTSVRRTLAGATFTAELPAEVCPSCGEGIVADPVLERFELQVAGELAMRGLRAADSFRFVRRALGMTAAELGELLEVKAETVSRWERGNVPVDARAWALLGSLACDRLEGRDCTRRLLRAVAEPSMPAGPVSVPIG